MSPSGDLFGLDVANDRLVRVSTSTAAVTPVVDLNIDVGSYESHIAFDPDGRLWHVNQGSLYLVDIALGAVSLIGDTGEPVDALAIHDGKIYGASGWLVYEIDPLTAEITVIADFEGSWGGATFVWALSSDGQHLWAIWHADAPGGYPLLSIGIFDPLSGEFSCWAGDFGPAHNVGTYTLAMARQQGAIPGIPTVSLLGMVLMVALLIASGIAVIHLRR